MPHDKLHAEDHVAETDAIQDATASVKGLATPTQITKLDGIEALAEVNNISDVNATDLTDAGETALHTHPAGLASVVQQTTNVTLTAADHGKHYVTSGAAATIIFTFPVATTTPIGTWYRFSAGSGKIDITSGSGGGVIVMPWGDVGIWQGHSLQCDTAKGSILLIKTAAQYWNAFDATGYWYDSYTHVHGNRYDGTVLGATENNVPKFDHSGCIIDSGVSIASAGLTKYDATVGSTGADYTTVSAAVTAIGGGFIKLLLVTNVTETADIDLVGESLFLDLSSYTLTMGTYEFTCGGPTCLTIVGLSSSVGYYQGEINYAHTVSGEGLFNAAASSRITLSNLTIDNNSTATFCGLVDSAFDAIQDFDNIKIELPNVQGGGLSYANNGSKWTNIHLVGGGTGCHEVLKPTDGLSIVMSDIMFSGSFAYGTGEVVALLSEDHLISNVVCDNATAMLIDLSESASINGLRVTGSGGRVHFDLGLDSSLVDAEIGSGNVDVTGARAHVSNVRSTGLLDMTDTGAVNALVDDCRFTTALVVAGDRCKFSNCDFLGGATVNSGADNNGFVNCQFGPDAGAGELLLTIASGANGTRVVACMSDAGISDSGTGTVTAANTEY